MRGRHPKPPDQRQRRNKTTTAATLEARPEQLAIAAALPPKAKRPATPVRKPKAGRVRATNRAKTRRQPLGPSRPRSAPQRKAATSSLPSSYHWHPETTAWWRDVWESPMAEQWLASDVHVLRRLAVLVNEYWHRPTPTVLAEIRQQEARFGLTPMDRHRLQWKIDMDRDAAGSGPDESDAPPPPTKDPREALRLVK